MTRLSIRTGAAANAGPACATAVLVLLGSVCLATAGGAAVQDEPATDEVALVTVVGCLAEEPGDLPWILERATAGEPTEQAFTSEEELARSAGEALGDLRYRLLGVGEFGVESHVGHRVQTKGLKLRYDGEWRLNITSFQHLAPTCE